jgi:hypothetical protein
VRYHELFEVEPDYRLLRRRLDQRVTDLWNQAADDPAAVLAEARRLADWLRSASITGDGAHIRNTCLAELFELIRFLQS